MAELPLSSSSEIVRKKKTKRKKITGLKKSGQTRVREAGIPCDTSASHESTSPESSTYEDELDWCIRMLKLGLLRKKVTETQRKESSHIIKKLSSDKTPVPRKRQMMRSVFGDYRTQMKLEPLHTLPVTGEPVRKILRVKRDKCMTSGRFFRQSTSQLSSLLPSSLTEKESTEIFMFSFQ